MRPRDRSELETEWATVSGQVSRPPFFLTLLCRLRPGLSIHQAATGHPVMKLKQRPADFVVEELTNLTPGSQGAFAFYRLEKSGWTTPDALLALRRRWKIDAHHVSFAGLKDRHALTIQYLTIFRGPRRDLRLHDILVRYLGQVTEPCESRHLRANQFRITLRDLTPAAATGVRVALGDVSRDGLPNYFDDQRFGSVHGHGEFMARQLVLGRFEDALRIALTAPYEYDRAQQKREKQTLRTHWGDWAACRERLPHGHVRELIEYLQDRPDDFRGAIARLRPELRGLYLAAYQSFLWNRMLAQWLERHCRPDQLIYLSLRLGPVPFPRNLDEAPRAELATLLLPLPSARLHLAAEDPRGPLIQSVLAEDGLELRQLRVKGVREMFFSKGERAAHVTPEHLDDTVTDDELNRGRQKLTLVFELPRGAYATLLVKRVTQGVSRT